MGTEEGVSIENYQVLKKGEKYKRGVRHAMMGDVRHVITGVRHTVNSSFSASLNRWKTVTAHGIVHRALWITKTEQVKTGKCILLSKTRRIRRGSVRIWRGGAAPGTEGKSFFHYPFSFSFCCLPVEVLSLFSG